LSAKAGSLISGPFIQHFALSDGWAYGRYYDSEITRPDALPAWLHFYNHHGAHSAIGGLPPISRLTNLPGHHT
jgi:transposase InsO family protein